MFAQAEHDELAQAILMTTSEKLINSVAETIDDLIKVNQEKILLKNHLSFKRFIYKS